MKITYDVAILGAGPYGLSIAAHLRKRGANFAIFGKPMAFWQDHMPKGMLLRSRWWDTSLSDPEGKYSIADYLRYIGIKPFDPMPGKMIVDYGLWLQANLVPDIDETFIKHINKHTDIFSITLIDGRTVTAKKVIMAPGLGYYAYKPEQFSSLPKQFVSHTYDNYAFSTFKGKRVVIVGGGQSGLENAALMSEAGIDVHIIHRSPIDWLGEPKEKNILQYLRSPIAPISDGWDNFLLGLLPYTFQKLPRVVKDDYLQGKGRNGPAGSHWLIPRLKNVTMHGEQTIEKVTSAKNKLTATLSSGQTLSADHIVFATGYKLDVTKLPMLDQSLLQTIKQYKKSPVLNSYFESSVPGLYFVGFSSFMSFGPLFRFVAGADATAKRISQAITNH